MALQYSVAQIGSYVARFFRLHYLLVLFVLLLPIARNRVEVNLRGIIWSDGEGYYMYLPAVFCIGDIHKVPEASMNARKNEQGELVMKYTCGVAMFQMPFFLIAKWYSDTHGFPPDSIFNANYSRAVAATGYCVGFLGLFFLQLALRRRGLRESVVFLTLLATFGGTNLFHYMTKEVGMSHAYSFCLFAFLVWQLPRFLERPDWRNAALLGGALGWIILIRPTNILALLFVLLADVYSWQQLRARILFFWNQKTACAVMAVAGFAFLFPQMLYWHEMTGHWVRYSYEGEDFIFWNHPKILAVLFDPQNGLFLYSPMVLLMVLGMVLGWREKKHHGPAALLIFVAGTYIFASWWAWWFGGAFGHRAYVELYAVFAFPLALVIEKILALRLRWLRYLCVGLILFLIYYGVKMSFLYNQLPGPWDGDDWRWNWDKILWIWEYLFK